MPTMPGPRETGLKFSYRPDMSEAKHIFIVDDQRVYINLLDYIFKKDFSYRFLSYKAAEECLDNMDLNPELIVMTYPLPGMDGMEAIRRVKEMSPHTHLISVIHSYADGVQSALFENGADDFLVLEEVQEGELEERIENYLTREVVVSGMRGHISRIINRNVVYLVLALLAIGAGIYYYQ